MLDKILAKLGLGERERRIYLTMLQVGPSSAAQIGRELGLPRQTVYSILQRFLGDKLIEQSDKGGVKQFFADPNDLLSLLEAKKISLERDRERLEKELPKLLSLRRRSRAFPKIQYYDGGEGLKRLLDNILGLCKQGKDQEFRGYGVNLLNETAIGDYLREFVEIRHQLGVQTKLIIGRGSDDFEITNESKALGRKVKRINIAPTQAGMYLVGERLFLFSYADNVGVMIENKAIVMMLKSVFDNHWQIIP